MDQSVIDYLATIGREGGKKGGRAKLPNKGFKNPKTLKNAIEASQKKAQEREQMIKTAGDLVIPGPKQGESAHDFRRRAMKAATAHLKATVSEWKHVPAVVDGVDKSEEYYDSASGRVINDGDGDWSAFVIIPPNPELRAVGECYPSAKAAQAAVRRAQKKYAPKAEPVPATEPVETQESVA